MVTPAERFRVSMRRLTLIAVGSAPSEHRAEVEDGLASAGIEFEGHPTGDGLVAYVVAGGRAVQAEARMILHTRGA